MSNISDKEILKLFHSDDSRDYGFNLLVKKYQEQIYRNIRRIVIDHEDANDIVQNTFIKIFKNLDNFKQKSELFTWIYKIATNESLSFLKSKRKRYLLPLTNVEHILSEELHDDNFFSGDEILLKLQKAILTLPEKQRIVFNMKYYDELSYEDISKVLGTSVGALKASYHFAVKKIEKYIIR